MINAKVKMQAAYVDAVSKGGVEDQGRAQNL